MITKTKHYQKLDSAHYLHPFTNTKELADNALIIEKADNVYLWDTDGNQILDGMSGLWCVNIGYGRHELANAAFAQMQELPYYNSFFKSATPKSIELAAALTEIAPDGFNHVFFTGSGSESNDTIIRMIRHYWSVQGYPDRNVIISRHNSYHGSTVASASLGGMAAMHAQGGLPIPNIEHIRQPYYFGEGQGHTEEEFGLLCAKALADKIEEVGAHRVAAFIGEPVQGAGGVIIPPSNYWQAIQAICDKHNIPIVADEVICGFGRLGTWFGSDKLNIRPKLMPIAKGLTSGYLPMGGVLVHDDIADVLINQGEEFVHGFTYSGHPTCAAVALENLRILREEKIIENVNDVIGPYFAEQWQKLGQHEKVAESRCIGMVGALELTSGYSGSTCRDLCIQNHLVMRAIGNTMIASPALVMTKSQIDELVQKATSALDALPHQ